MGNIAVAESPRNAAAVLVVLVITTKLQESVLITTSIVKVGQGLASVK